MSLFLYFFWFAADVAAESELTRSLFPSGNMVSLREMLLATADILTANPLLDPRTF